MQFRYGYLIKKSLHYHCWQCIFCQSVAQNVLNLNTIVQGQQRNDVDGEGAVAEKKPSFFSMLYFHR